MPLALYRRHRQGCKGGHPHNSRTSEYDQRKKGWKQCECPIFASGTLHRHFRRHNTGQWEFEAPILFSQISEAEAFPTMAEMERAIIVAAYERSNRKPLEAARLLGIGKTTVYRKLREMGEAAA